MLKFKDSKEVAMNAEARAVFEALRRIAGDDGVYKVIEAEEVLERLPAEMSSAGKQQLGTVIRQLRDDGFVKVKYFTPDEYCLLVENRQPEPETPAAPAVTEERPAAGWQDRRHAVRHVRRDDRRRHSRGDRDIAAKVPLHVTKTECKPPFRVR